MNNINGIRQRLRRIQSHVTREMQVGAEGLTNKVEKKSIKKDKFKM